VEPVVAARWLSQELISSSSRIVWVTRQGVLICFVASIDLFMGVSEIEK
jgi:hypothetical protein